MPAEVLTAFERRFGVRLLDTYGMTECEPLTLPVPGTPPGSCGWPSPDFKVAVLDEEDRPLPAGTAGRICVRPRTPYVMMLGYEADPEATVEAWRNLWFHTADRGRFDAEGFLHFLDRISMRFAAVVRTSRSMAISPASFSSARRRTRRADRANANSPARAGRGVKCRWLRGPATAFTCFCSQGGWPAGSDSCADLQLPLLALF